jgi:VWFA-related protein
MRAGVVGRAVLAVGLLSLSGRVVRAQAAASASDQASVSESAQVSLVLLPVTVLDAKGEPIRGLSVSDFQVLDDGRPVTLTSVDVEERPVSGGQSAPAAPSAPPPSAFSAPRKIVLAFDLSSPSPSELSDARRAAVAFVRKRMEPGDLVAIATVGEGRHATISRRFAGNPGSIVSEIDKVHAVASAGLRNPTAETSSLMDSDIVAGARQSEFDYRASRSSSLVDSLEELAATLAAVDGPKQVLLFSRGERGIGGAAGAFLAAHCELDAIVTGGIVAAETSLSDHGFTDPHGGAGLDALDDLASTTGGLLLRSGNDLSEEIGRLLEAESVVYVLGFTPSRSGTPGRFHRVTVRVARKKVHVVSRPGYIEPAP